MQAKFECVPCFARQSLKAARIATDDVTLQERIIRETLHRLTRCVLSTASTVNWAAPLITLSSAMNTWIPPKS